jgi:hypothetical protein
MPLSFSLLPNEPVLLSGNPVIVEISTDQVSVINHFILANVLLNSEVVGTYRVNVENGKALFDLSVYMRKQYTGHFTLLATESFIKADILSVYNVEFIEFYNNSIHGSISANLPILQGKLTDSVYKILEANNNTFYGYFIQSKKMFLTWQPSKYIYTDSIERLYYFNQETDFPVTLKADVTYTDGTKGTYDIASGPLEQNIIYECAVDYESLKLSLYESDLVKVKLYDVYLAANNFPISEKVTYIINRNTVKKRNFCFLNSLGCYDFISLSGESETNTEITKEFGTQGINKILNNVQYTSAIKLSFGWLNAIYGDVRRAMKYTTDFVISKDVYEIVDYYALPSIVTTKKIQTSTDKQYLLDIIIEYQNVTDTAYSEFVEDKFIEDPTNLPLVISEDETYIAIGDGGSLKYM